MGLSHNRIYGLMVLATFFWSGAFIAGKLALREFPPFALTFFRFFFALPLIFPILYLREPGNWWPKREQWVPLITLGIVGIFGYHAFFFSALKYTTAINSSLIASTNPMITFMLAALIGQDRVTPLRLLGMILSFTGVFLIVTNGDWSVVSTFRFNVGDILIWAGVWCWAVYSLLGRSFMNRYSLSPLVVTAYTFLVCAAVSVPLVIWENPALYLPKTTLVGWLSIVYMAVFASVLGYLVFMTAVQKVGAPRAAVFFNLVPVLTIIQSVIYLGEPFSWFKLVSAAVIICGVFLTTRPEADGQADENPSPAAVRPAVSPGSEV